MQTLMGCSVHIAAALTHVRMHSAIEHERARLRAILDQLPEGILITEATNGTVSYINEAAARIFGTPAQQLTDIPLHHLPSIYHAQNVKRHSLPPWNFMIIRALIGETITGEDTVIMRSDGSRSFLLSSAAPLRTKEGVISGAVIVFQDVTAKKTIEQQKFERFHRSSSIDSAISGLGIGLYLVKELVSRHDGHVWAESIEGAGSAFYVKFPLGSFAESR